MRLLVQKAFLGLAMFVVWIAGYLPINLVYLHGEPVLHDLATPLDALIPFWPVAVYPYATIYFIVWAPYLMVRNRREMVRVTATYVFGLMCAYVIFVVLPTGITRPELPHAESGALALLADIYANDMPVACFPSTHCLMAITAAAATWRNDWIRFRPVGALVWLWAACIVASVVLIRQHVLADALGAALIYYLGWRMLLRGRGIDRVEAAARAWHIRQIRKRKEAQ